MSGHLEMSEKKPKRKSMFDAVFIKWLPFSIIARLSRHPYSPVTPAKAGVQCAATGRLSQALWIPACAGMTVGTAPLPSPTPLRSPVAPPVIRAKPGKRSEGSYPHTPSRDARCAPAVDMPGWGQLLRTCPHP